MSDEEAGVVFQDSAGAEAFAAEAPEAEGGKPGEFRNTGLLSLVWLVTPAHPSGG